VASISRLLEISLFAKEPYRERLYSAKETYNFEEPTNRSHPISILRNVTIHIYIHMGWLWLVGSIKLLVSFAKEPYKRDNILRKRPIILSILLTVATPYIHTLETCT